MFKVLTLVIVSMQMATLDKAEHLLEDLRKASSDTAKQELEDIKDFARQQVGGAAPRASLEQQAEVLPVPSAAAPAYIDNAKHQRTSRALPGSGWAELPPLAGSRPHRHVLLEPCSDGPAAKEAGTLLHHC